MPNLLKVSVDGIYKVTNKRIELYYKNNCIIINYQLTYSKCEPFNQRARLIIKRQLTQLQTTNSDVASCIQRLHNPFNCANFN